MKLNLPGFKSHKNCLKEIMNRFNNKSKKRVVSSLTHPETLMASSKIIWRFKASKRTSTIFLRRTTTPKILNYKLKLILRNKSHMLYRTHITHKKFMTLVRMMTL